MNVYVVEDDKDIADMYRDYLSMVMGYEVTVIRTGSEAFDRFSHKNESPNAIVLDMHLPGKSGSEIYALMEQRALANRILVCSADMDIVAKYSNMGATAIAKPVTLKKLGELVRGITGEVL